MGLHEYDGRVTNLSRTSIEQEHDRLRSFRQRLVAKGSIWAAMRKEPWRM